MSTLCLGGGGLSRTGGEWFKVLRIGSEWFEEGFDILRPRGEWFEEYLSSNREEGVRRVSLCEPGGRGSKSTSFQTREGFCSRCGHHKRWVGLWRWRGPSERAQEERAKNRFLDPPEGRV